MKLEVFKSPKAKTPSPVYLALEQRDQGVLVQAVDEFGTPIPGGYLLSLTNDGTITRYSSVMRSLGFKLDRAGRIELFDTGD